VTYLTPLASVLNYLSSGYDMRDCKHRLVLVTSVNHFPLV